MCLPFAKGVFHSMALFFFSGCNTILYCNMSILWSAIKKNLSSSAAGAAFVLDFFQESNCSLFFDCAAPWIWNGFFWWLVVVVAWGTLHAIKNRWWWCYSTWYSMTVGIKFNRISDPWDTHITDVCELKNYPQKHNCSREMGITPLYVKQEGFNLKK